MKLTSNITATPTTFRWDDGHLGRVFQISPPAYYTGTGELELTMTGNGTASWRISKEQAADLFTALQAWIEQL